MYLYKTTNTGDTITLVCRKIKHKYKKTYISKNGCTPIMLLCFMLKEPEIHI